MKKNQIYHWIYFLCIITTPNILIAKNQTITSQEYKIIKQELLNKYKRPFTILILGDSTGDASLKIAKEFSAIVVMIEEDSSDLLLNKCKNNHLDNTILFQKKIKLGELRMLSESEHFDVVIAADVKRFQQGWKSAIDSLYNSTDYLVISLEKNPTIYEKMIRSYIFQQKKKYKILKTGNKQIFLISSKKSSIQRKWWGKKKILRPGSYKILSDFANKYIHKNNCNKTNKWVHGINLATFYMLGGSYPNRDSIVKELENLKNIEHSDNSMTNIVIQGQKLELIDFDREEAKSSNKINYVIDAFKGEIICGNEPNDGYIRCEPSGAK